VKHESHQNRLDGVDESCKFDRRYFIARLCLATGDSQGAAPARMPGERLCTADDGGRLQALADVGLGYVALGQSGATLSGGEAQRVKLATELQRRTRGRNVYVLDEPTTGLHFDDVKRLIEVLDNLVEQGNTVIVIEHNLDLIKSADWVIDMGPEGGDGGGTILAVGTPEQVAADPASVTGRYLARALAPNLAAIA
jgi:excinuclease ABC subunit A